jgi:hypothetical protein
MWTVVGVVAGFAMSTFSVYLGFYLARLSPSSTPGVPARPETFEGTILDQAVYEDEVADE